MRQPVVYDASVLYPQYLRDLLLRLAIKGIVRALWTDQIVSEMLAARLKHRPDLDPDKLERLRGLINNAVDDCLIEGYEPLIEQVRLRDPSDRHVVAAAIYAKADLIVANDKDFTAEDLAVWSITPKTADDFVLDCIDADPTRVWACVEEIAASHTAPPETAEDVLSRLEHGGLLRSVAALRSM